MCRCYSKTVCGKQFGFISYTLLLNEKVTQREEEAKTTTAKNRVHSNKENQRMRMLSISLVETILLPL